jgi:hypothetical protein
LGRFRSITHPFAARQHVLLHLLPLDLHVLGTPPAFNLSQDQTLHLKISTIIKKSGSKMAPTYCWTFWSLGLFRQRLETRVPTQITCQTFKEHPGAQGLGKWAVNRIMAHSLTAPAASRLGLQGARSIAPIGGLSTHCHVRSPGLKGAGERGSDWGRGNARGGADDS